MKNIQIFIFIFLNVSYARDPKEFIKETFTKNAEARIIDKRRILKLVQ